MLAYKEDRAVRLVSRNGVDHTARFAAIAQAIANLPARTLILDGEVAVFGEKPISRFHLLREPDPAILCTPPVYVAFDCLVLRACDLRRDVLAGTPRLVRSTSPFADHVPLRGMTWLVPELIAEISYAEAMRGWLRDPVFRGIVAIPGWAGDSAARTPAIVPASDMRISVTRLRRRFSLPSRRESLS